MSSSQAKEDEKKSKKSKYVGSLMAREVPQQSQTLMWPKCGSSQN